MADARLTGGSDPETIKPTPDSGGSGATAELRGSVWTLRTWFLTDRAEGFDYGYPSRESAERNGRMFAEDERAGAWQVIDPDGAVVQTWKREDGSWLPL